MKKYEYSGKQLQEAVRRTDTLIGVLRILGIPWSGWAQSKIKQQIKLLCFDTSHFTGQAHQKGRVGHPCSRKIPWQNILCLLPVGSVKRSSSTLRRAMVESGFLELCLDCGIGGQWRNKNLVLHIDHINGNPIDNRKENLRFLCPNCHSQTETYCGKNVARDEKLLSTLFISDTLKKRPRPHKRKVDYALVIAAARIKNFNQVAKEFGLSWNGVKRIMGRYDPLSGLV